MPYVKSWKLETDCRKALDIMKEWVHLIHLCMKMHFFIEIYDEGFLICRHCINKEDQWKE